MNNYNVPTITWDRFVWDVGFLIGGGPPIMVYVLYQVSITKRYAISLNYRVQA
jgi:hypothetical protein